MVKETVLVETQPTMTEESLGYLKSGAAWAQFLAIVSFVFCGLAFLGGILMAIMSFVAPSLTSISLGIPMYLLGVFYIVISAIGFIVTYYLYRFAVDSLRAIQRRDTEFLTRGMRAMKRYFKINGIIMILAMVSWIPLVIILMAGM